MIAMVRGGGGARVGVGVWGGGGGGGGGRVCSVHVYVSTCDNNNM